MTSLRMRTGGTESPTILLLHGLGATADVWTGLPEESGATAWVAPDLPGMVTAEQIAALGVGPIELPGLGHNAHVEKPAIVREMLERV
jgi:pimeloyl-ACP methyl ester carboxylesterase